MSHTNLGRVLTLPNSGEQVLSIRAKALVFDDPRSQAILDQMEFIAPSDATVLLVGETGTGKELVARHIHEQSGRNGPFLAVNCGAFSETLVEAELFGHEAGSFTGASHARAGWFESANGGTLFLDEVGDMPLSLQVKLLRVLQERQVVRIGSRKPVPIDVRLVAATNVELERAVMAGHFRRDLYYRLNVAKVVLPPLRERRGDILPLARHFLAYYSSRMGTSLPGLHDAAGRLLVDYSWPGNIRELENVIHFALLVASDGPILPEHLKISGGLAVQTPPGSDTRPPLDIVEEQLRRLFESPGDSLLDDIEARVVTAAYTHTRHNQVRTAELLGVSRNIVRTLLKRHGLIEGSSRDDSGAEPAIPSA